jgi:hypothetical protein
MMRRCRSVPAPAAAIAVVVAVLLACAAPSLLAQQSGKPPYDPAVEPIARSIFLELMSPY